MSQIEERLGEIAKFAQSREDVLALRTHLRELLESSAFSGSRRSGQFLKYVVEQALAQQNDALKERTIGVEVFQRPPDYDTGEDAIVRVTASDVRRRLAQHYSGPGRAAEFRVNLPPGGYVPEIECDLPRSVLDAGGTAPAQRTEQPSLPLKSSLLVSAHATVEEDPKGVSTMPSAVAPGTVQTASAHAVPAKRQKTTRELVKLITIALSTLLAAGVLLVGSGRSTDTPVPQPWQRLFSGPQPVRIILADPDLNEIQNLTGHYVPLSDYANGKLGCDRLQPALQGLCTHALRGDKVAEVDASAITHIAAIAAQFHSSLEAHAARSLRLSDLQTNQNVILLGSRVANPWADLYSSRMHFLVDHDAVSGLQVVRNVEPAAGESALYMPTAGPYGTGDTYALISFVRNLSGNGYALLLAGCTHEGMDAAVAAVLNKREFDTVLTKCAVGDRDPFQVLLRLHMMAGSSLTAEPLACHRLT